jgi:hypothetical protein
LADDIGKVISRFLDSVNSGCNWYISLLEAARAWPVGHESMNGSQYHYLIGKEAFDLVQLAERFIKEAKTLIPEEEQIALLFHGKPPVALDNREVKNILGDERYRQLLNYFYGVTVEEALQEVTSSEVRKEGHGVRAHSEVFVANEAFIRIYRKPQQDLLDIFCIEKGLNLQSEASLSGIKEFTYWLFKYRLAHNDPEKSASDTKKALEWLKKQGQHGFLAC